MDYAECSGATQFVKGTAPSRRMRLTNRSGGHASFAAAVPGRAPLEDQVSGSTGSNFSRLNFPKRRLAFVGGGPIWRALHRELAFS